MDTIESLLTKLIGTYTPVVSTSGQIGLDIAYIVRAILLLIFVWFGCLCMLNVLKGVLRNL